MEERLTARRISIDGRVLNDGVRQASARSEEPILCVAKANTLTFVAVSGLRLVASWEYCLPAPMDRPAVFLIPPMIVSHLVAAQGPGTDKTEVVLDGNQVALITSDELGSYELHWRSDPRSFPAPPEMGRLLSLPAHMLRLRYLDVSDAVHQAVIDLVGMEAERQIHRTRLALMIDVCNGDLEVIGKEIEIRASGQHYFDPRLIIRALEMVRAEQVEVGLTILGPLSAFLSIVDRRRDYTIHCALLSIGRDTQRLFPLPRGRS